MTKTCDPETCGYCKKHRGTHDHRVPECQQCSHAWRPDRPTDDDLARQFHNAYESLAAEYGYTTRPETAVPWEDVPENNRRLMVAVVDAAVGARIRELEAENAKLHRAIAMWKQEEDRWNEQDARTTALGNALVDANSNPAGVRDRAMQAAIDDWKKR